MSCFEVNCCVDLSVLSVHSTIPSFLSIQAKTYRMTLSLSLCRSVSPFVVSPSGITTLAISDRLDM